MVSTKQQKQKNWKNKLKLIQKEPIVESNIRITTRRFRKI
jgi:hypothetical protein